MTKAQRDRTVFSKLFREKAGSVLTELDGVRVAARLVRGVELDDDGNEQRIVVDEKQEVAFRKLQFDALRWLTSYAYGNPAPMDKLEGDPPAQEMVTASEALERLPQVLRNLGIDSAEKFQALMAQHDVKMIVGTKE